MAEPKETALAIVVPSEDSHTPDKGAALLAVTPQRTRQERLRGLLDAFLRGRKASTIRAYAKDLDVFTVFVRAPTREAAVTHLLAQEPGEANAIALSYRNYMVEKKLGSATINRRLACLRAFVKLARMLGLVTWAIEVENVHHESYIDILGPGTEAVGQLVAQCYARGDAHGARNAAIIRLLFDRGLRRGEAVTLDLEHYDPKRGIALLGKGKTQRVWYQLPEAADEALRAWLKLRGSAPGPLFTALGDRHCGNRLTGNRIYEIIRALGDQIGAKARPHGLRHAAISEAIVQTNGNISLVQRFSRHANVNTIMRYDDARRDDALKVSKLVSATVPVQARPRAVGYARVSCKSQLDGYGLERQRLGIEQWAKEHHVDLVAVIEEKPLSGDTPIDKRPGMLEALRLLEEREAAFLVAEARDRLVRSVDVGRDLDARVDSLGATIVTTSIVEAEFHEQIRDAIQRYDEARTLVAACGRGHVHEGALAIGKYCTEGDCFMERGSKLPVRRIEWRPA